MLYFYSKNNVQLRHRGLGLFFFLWLIGISPTTAFFLKPLENQYATPSVTSLQAQGITKVVVLTGGGYPISHDRLSSAFPHGSIYRYLGGLELCSALGDDCQLIFSGSSGSSERHTAITMQELTVLIDPNQIVFAEAESNSTADHPKNVRRFVGQAPFVLVTSAYHMARAMSVFSDAGLNPIPYPVDFLTTSDYAWESFLPSTNNIDLLQVGIREYLATAYYRVR